MSQGHWEAIWRERQPDELSWYQPKPDRSIELIEKYAGRHESLIDVGAGASAVVDRLLDDGCTDLTVLDISEAAVAITRQRLGDRAHEVRWLVGDVLTQQFEGQFVVWHDRAVFHFLISPRDRTQYLQQLDRALAPGGHVVLATFGPQGPDQCSGLPVRRYGEPEIRAAFGDSFSLIEYSEESHTTPSGSEQQFAFGVLRHTPR
jgi:SAM-dependent methyltransferase